MTASNDSCKRRDNLDFPMSTFHSSSNGTKSTLDAIMTTFHEKTKYLTMTIEEDETSNSESISSANEFEDESTIVPTSIRLMLSGYFFAPKKSIHNEISKSHDDCSSVLDDYSSFCGDSEDYDGSISEPTATIPPLLCREVSEDTAPSRPARKKSANWSNFKTVGLEDSLSSLDFFTDMIPSRPRRRLSNSDHNYKNSESKQTFIQHQPCFQQANTQLPFDE